MKRLVLLLPLVLSLAKDCRGSARSRKNEQGLDEPGANRQGDGQ